MLVHVLWYVLFANRLPMFQSANDVHEDNVPKYNCTLKSEDAYEDIMIQVLS